MEVSKLFREPFDHIVIDNFCTEDIAIKISNEFPSYEDTIWDSQGYVYNSEIEKKKTLRDWGIFKDYTYQLFMHLCSDTITQRIESLFRKSNDILPNIIVADYGLHGAGYHIHKTGDHLNIHLDYSIHPRATLQRKFNFILYLTPNWNPEWGGGLEFWSHDTSSNQPKEKIKTIENVFRRAVIFDTTQNSWHGISEPLKCPSNVYRKSIAMYYLQEPKKGAEERKRALYAPLENQKNKQEILELIEKRSQL